jgi:O-antigen/teichoic acid export membrane protein
LIILGATALAALANVIVQFLLARTLGPEQFGAFVSALAMVTLFSPLAAFGVGSWWLRAFGEEGYAAQRWVKPSLQLSVHSSLAVIALLMAWANLGPHDDLTGIIIATLTSVILAQVIFDLVNAKFQLEAQYTSLAAWQLASHPLRLLGLVLLTFQVSSITALHVAYLYLGISFLVSFLGCFCLASFYRGKICLAGYSDPADLVNVESYQRKPTLKNVLIKTFPFSAEAFLFLMYYQTDLILLNYFVSKEEVGFYGASIIFMAAVYLPPSVLYQKFLLPKIHCWAYEKSNRFQRFIVKPGILLFICGLLVTLFIWSGASYFLPLILGEDYRPSVSLLTLMCLGIPFRYLSVHLGSILSTRDFIWINLKITGVTALLNIFLNLLLIPQYGAVGAAFATVLSYITLAGLFVITTQKRLKVYGSNK